MGRRAEHHESSRELEDELLPAHDLRDVSRDLPASPAVPVSHALITDSHGNGRTQISAFRRFRLRIASWRPTPGSGIELVYRLARVNSGSLIAVVVLATVAAGMFYVPAMFLRGVVRYLEIDPERERKEWGFVFCVGLFLSHAATQIRECLSLSH